MLGIDAWTMLYCGILGGFLGGAICLLAHNQTSKFNRRMMEDFWRNDIARIDMALSGCDMRIETILSTISADKSVNNDKNYSDNKSYKNRPRFDQRG